jgi:hypothetical protein
MAALLFVLMLALPQESAEEALFRKCDRQIPWITDGVELEDGTPSPPLPDVDRLALLERAKTQAREQNRQVLWYCPRLAGTHTTRAANLDIYARVALFTDPRLVDHIKATFVPLRMACDAKTAAATGIKFPERVEPAIFLITPEGKIVKTIDRIRTFSADAVRASLGGGTDRSPYRQIAREALEKDGSPEAIYYLSAHDLQSGRDPEPRWRTLVAKHPDSPWAWRAASNLIRGRDGLRQGPMAHLVEDLIDLPAGEPAARAVEFLLRGQQPDGSWSEARYSYGWAKYMIQRRIKEGLLDPSYTSWPDRTLQPNVFVAVTALAARALLEWRDLAPERIDAALARAEKVLVEDERVSHMACEACYAEAYRLQYFTGRKDVPRMNRLVRRLADLQDRDGFWGHEYPSAFATAAIVHILVEARKAGADVPEALFRRSADALLKTRAEDGRQAYRHEPGKPMSSEKNSMGRTASSELALLECGRGSLTDVAAGVDAYWKHLARLEAVRLADNHADEELAGFFYFNSVFNTLEAARALEQPLRGAHLEKFRAQIRPLPEPDGSFVDSHELGKSYGTAMALLILRRLR